MLLFHPTANLLKLKKAGGLAVVGKTPTTTGFGGLQMPTFHQGGTEKPPKKNEVSGFGFPNPCHN